MKILKLLLVSAFLINIPVYADGVVLANKAIGISSIESKILRKMFLGRVTLWDNGTAVAPCYLEAFNPEMDHFYDKVLRQNRDKFSRFWVKKLFAGAGVAPKALTNETTLLSLVSNSEGGICYTDKVPSTLPANVVVLSVQ